MTAKEEQAKKYAGLKLQVQIDSDEWYYGNPMRLHKYDGFIAGADWQLSEVIAEIDKMIEDIPLTLNTSKSKVAKAAILYQLKQRLTK